MVMSMGEMIEKNAFAPKSISSISSLRGSRAGVRRSSRPNRPNSQNIITQTEKISHRLFWRNCHKGRWRIQCIGSLPRSRSSQRVGRDRSCSIPEGREHLSLV